MSSQHSQLLSVLRTNYINAKNDYFQYLHTYNKTFWNNLIKSFTNFHIKKNIRLIINFNKIFIKNKLNTHNISNNTHHTTHHNQIQSTQQQPQTQRIISDYQTNSNIINTTQTQITNTNTNIINNPKNTKLTPIINDSKINKTKPKNTTPKNKYEDIIDSIILNLHTNMENFNVKGDWCFFKKCIYQLYIDLSSEYSKNNQSGFKIMSKKGLQKEIVILLDMYKEHYDSYKSYFNSNNKQKTIFINNPEKHPLIQNIIKSFTDTKFATEFINIVNSKF